MTAFESKQTIPSFKLELSKNTRLSNKSLELLVPLFIREQCHSPKEIELKVIFDAPTLQNTFIYELEWEEDDDASVGKYEKILRQSSPQTSLQSSGSRSWTGGAPVPVDMLCDGPCKRVFPSNLLNTIGRCGHYLCNACFGIVKNSDGTNGCSSYSCYWKGSSREEARMYYEKEVCRVQRARARNMKKRGIDVKSASETFSTVEEDNPSTVSTATSSETNCSVKSLCSTSSSSSASGGEEKMICVKLVIVEQAEGDAMLHTFTNTKSSPHAKVSEVLSSLVDLKREKIESASTGILYYTEMTSENSKKMRRVHTKHFKVLELSQFPKIDGSVVFVLDLGAFIEKGNAVYLK